VNLSEAAKIALLQEVMKEAKQNERGGLVACIVGIIVSVAGFSTTSLAANSFNLGILGIVIAAIGFVVYLYYARAYLRFVGQLASMVSKSSVPCPHCGKPLPKGEFAFCPFCGSQLSLDDTVQKPQP
jgi:type III secretory pathway component EscS